MTNVHTPNPGGVKAAQKPAGAADTPRIPLQFQNPNYRFVLLKQNSKIPFELEWQTKNNYTFDNPKLISWMEQGGNVGIISGYGQLHCIDDDTGKLSGELKDIFADTYQERTWSGKTHFFILSDYAHNHVFINGLGEYRAVNYQAVITPSKIEGKAYEPANDKPLKFFSAAEIQAILKPYLRTESTTTAPQQKDDSRSATEYRRVIAMISRGQSKDFIFKEMMAFKKWSEALEQYRELTYQKALAYVEGQRENKKIVDTTATAEEMELLKNPDLLNIIDRELDKKIVGEKDARKVIFLIVNMRNVANQNKGSDNLIVNAVSGTGKDHVTEGVFGLIPDEEKEELIRTTPKVLAYTRNQNIDKNATWEKIALRLEDVSSSVINDDSFKVFLSANPNKINVGKTMIKQTCVEIKIFGKPSIILTLADQDIKDQQLRRLPTLFLDEGLNQTKEILKRQAAYAAEGRTIEYDDNLIRAISKLKRVSVKIPFANNLTQIFDKSMDNVIVRTAFPRFLDYVRSSASLYQYQRKSDDSVIIAEKQDYDNAILCLKKTISNIKFIPLSKLDKSIYNYFTEKKLVDASLDNIMNAEEIQHLGKSERWIRFRLDFLVSKGFLRRSSFNVEHSFKPVNKYSFVSVDNLRLPTAEEIGITSNTTNNTFTSNTANTANTPPVNEVFEVFASELPIVKDIKHPKPTQKLNIYQALNQLGGQGSYWDLKSLMACSDSDLNQYLSYAVTNGFVVELPAGMYSLTEAGEALQ